MHHYKLLSLLCLISMIISGLSIPAEPITTTSTQTIELETTYSGFNITIEDDVLYGYVPEAEHNIVISGQPVLPADIHTYQLPFGSTVTNVSYTHSEIQTIPLQRQFQGITTPTYQTDEKTDTWDIETQDKDDITYPVDWVTTTTRGGIYQGEHVTHLNLRIHPLRYDPNQEALLFIQNISITITYEPPEEQLLDNYDIYDLLIITIPSFEKPLQDLVEHKEEAGIKTRLVTLDEIYDEMFWYGRDEPEKIKYYISHAVTYWGVSHVLLVGGLDGQTRNWNLPVRYSHVVPPTEQEYPEQSFLSDLYFADLYNSDGSFSSWDSNDDNLFSVWNQSFQEDMDLYPDIYLGRLPCRNQRELNIMIDKIITYETTTYGSDWFNNYLIVAGDSYPDEAGYNEGELIGDLSITLWPDCNPLKVYASEDDINKKTVNQAFNQGCGFAYFCGHGSPGSWSTHFPPDGNNWTTGYNNNHMKLLRNGKKLPIIFIGGCHNGQFDVGLYQLFDAIQEDGFLGTFLRSPYTFFYNGWRPNCWTWELVSHNNGGGIAAIGNTGLGTHGDGDLDRNGVADYLEVLDGWLELRFLEMYGTEGKTNLGENHGDCMTEYLNVFIQSNERMDIKMVQQWELFGDPSLTIGGILQT